MAIRMMARARRWVLGAGVGLAGVAVIGSGAAVAGDGGGPKRVLAGNALSRVDQNLAALRALGLVEVGTLVADVPGAFQHCYGPCKPSQLVGIRTEEAARLDVLAAVAAEVAALPAGPATPGTDGTRPAELAAQTALTRLVAQAEIAKLNALQIVSFGAFIETHPAARASPYTEPVALAQDVALDQVREAQDVVLDRAREARLAEFAKRAQARLQ